MSCYFRNVPHAHQVCRATLKRNRLAMFQLIMLSHGSAGLGNNKTICLLGQQYSPLGWHQRNPELQEYSSFPLHCCNQWPVWCLFPGSMPCTPPALLWVCQSILSRESIQGSLTLDKSMSLLFSGLSTTASRNNNCKEAIPFCSCSICMWQLYEEFNI